MEALTLDNETSPLAVINVNHLTKHYGSVKAVNDISFSVNKGEVFGFLGPNGAGKTTTIRCMMDFIRPTSGSISILEHNVSREGVGLRDTVGYLSGDVRLYPNLTGKDHIDLVKRIRGTAPLMDDLCDRLDFDPSKKSKNLSSGNKQKLGLILALMHDPKVIIMDEPTVGLDPLLQNTIYEILDEFKQREATIFLSSHNLVEVERICDRVGIIKDGTIVSLESISNLKQKQLHLVSAYFEGEIDKQEFMRDGVEKIEEIAGGFLFTVRGDINEFVSILAQYRLRNLEISHASLEDVFLRFYERGRHVSANHPQEESV